MIKYKFLFLFVILPFIVKSQNWFIGGSTSYGRSFIKNPRFEFFEFKKYTNEWNVGISTTYQFNKKISLHFNLNLNRIGLVQDTKNFDPFLGYDPEVNLKRNLNYLNPNIKLLYYKNNPIDGVSLGLGTYKYLYQTKNYDIAYAFDQYENLYNAISFGYYFKPIKNFMAELEFVGTITELGNSRPNSDEQEWEDKYWKYGLRVSVTYNFLSWPKKINSKKDK